VQYKKCKNVQDVEYGWETVFRDGQASLDQAKTRVRALKRSLRKIEEKMRLGEPFPGLPTSTHI
jgi:hypothetical protein